MKKAISVTMLGSLLAAVLSVSPASAYQLPATYTWDSTVPNYWAGTTLHNGTINTSTLVVGDYVGVNATTPDAISYGDSGVSVGWDDTWVGSVGDANTNGDALDGLWVQVYTSGGWWDLGSEYSQVAVFTSQDHGPYLGEGLEYKVFGSDSLWGTHSWNSTLVDVYLDGWRFHNPTEDINQNGWLSDDIAGVFTFCEPQRYIYLEAWSTTGGYDEPEIDAVAGVNPVPEPTTIILFGTGLAGLALVKRRRKK